MKLPELAYSKWEDSKDTLHLWLQIVGKIRMALSPEKCHWWHVTLYVSPRGLTTRTIPYSDYVFEMEFDFLRDLFVVSTSKGDTRSFDLKQKSVAQFYAGVFEILNDLGIRADIHPVPYDTISTIPFAQDKSHASYDGDAVREYWQALVFVDSVLNEFQSRFTGKESPVHLFWHSGDMAYARFSGRRGPEMEGARISDQNAYSHEVIAVGFWAGDPTFQEAAFYSYTYPAPDGIDQQPLEPAGAMWVEKNNSPLAVLRYADVRAADDPREAVLKFAESAYRAGATLAKWELDEFKYEPYRK